MIVGGDKTGKCGKYSFWRMICEGLVFFYTMWRTSWIPNLVFITKPIMHVLIGSIEQLSTSLILKIVDSSCVLIKLCYILWCNFNHQVFLTLHKFIWWSFVHTISLSNFNLYLFISRSFTHIILPKFA
jgi:hypothetical protein